MHTVALPVRTMRCVGVRLVIVTNAAGGLRSEYEVGDVAVIRDHVALPLLAGRNPLVGPNDDELGTRFPPTSDLYDGALQRIVLNSANALGYGNFLRLNATYAFVSGPQYESKAECAMLRSMGADAVGMSTIPEVVAAHHAGMAVLCLSLITNKVVFAADTTADTTTEEGGGCGGGGGRGGRRRRTRASRGGASGRERQERAADKAGGGGRMQDRGGIPSDACGLGAHRSEDGGEGGGRCRRGGGGGEEGGARRVPPLRLVFVDRAARALRDHGRRHPGRWNPARDEDGQAVILGFFGGGVGRESG